MFATWSHAVNPLSKTVSYSFFFSTNFYESSQSVNHCITVYVPKFVIEFMKSPCRLMANSNKIVGKRQLLQPWNFKFRVFYSNEIFTWSYTFRSFKPALRKWCTVRFWCAFFFLIFQNGKQLLKRNENS